MTARDGAADCTRALAGTPPETAEQCRCSNRVVVPDIGDGQVSCSAGAAEVARARFGIEGGVCCAKHVSERAGP